MAKSKFLNSIERDLKNIQKDSNREGKDNSYAFERLLGVEHGLIWSYNVEPWFDLQHGSWSEEVSDYRHSLFSKVNAVADSLFGKGFAKENIHNVASRIAYFNQLDANIISQHYSDSAIEELPQPGLHSYYAKKYPKLEVVIEHEGRKYQIRKSEKGHHAFIRYDIDFRDQSDKNPNWMK